MGESGSYSRVTQNDGGADPAGAADPADQGDHLNHHSDYAPSHDTAAADSAHHRLLSIAVVLLSALCVLLFVGMLALAGVWPMAALTAPSSGVSGSTRPSPAAFAPSLSLSSVEQSPVVLARTLYLFLCEGPAEANLYHGSFPSVTSDVMLYCWREPCAASDSDRQSRYLVRPWQSHSPLSSSEHLFTARSVLRQSNSSGPPSSSSSSSSSFSSHSGGASYSSVEGRVFVVNQADTVMAGGSTWTTGRNFMLEWALEQQRVQGWQWAYLSFGDGDTHVKCPHITNSTTRPSAFDAVIRHVAAEDGLQWEVAAAAANNGTSTTSSVAVDRLCWLAYDVTVLLLSPAVGYINIGRWSPELADNIELQTGFSYDAILNSFQHSAVAVLLPYCEVLDHESWYNSQLALVHRSACVYSHVLQLNYIQLDEGSQVHREYPRGPIESIFRGMEEYTERWNSVPDSVKPVYRGFLRPVVNGDNWNLRVQIAPVFPPTSYGGWSTHIMDPACFTTMNATACVRE